ncbi:sugar ABC transporter ATP-binding protein [Caldicellulosiruptor acetigenus]|uniref:sugar ABC transporter ATP-binding protein n=1 Tax=Caldicellulosiruptor acetigenus TaxID=301953 RepID=UPI0004A30919|nr:sugar ABC transporter ATP-binding protein [Caldicellulosiruptor acetigenus]
MATLLAMKNIHKKFPGVVALKGVNFNLNKGEIHALMGQNGAGKSTLIKILTGVERMDEGEIILEGQKIYPRNAAHAQQLGISTVYQETSLCPNLSVAENIFIGQKIKGSKKIKWVEIYREAKKILGEIGLDIDVKRNLSEYSVAVHQMVAIARALSMSSKVLILDEPTSSLEKWEVKNLFNVLKTLKEKGIGIIYITHFLDEVYEISDKITVLRNGELIGEFKTEELPKVQLIEKMIGRELKELETIDKRSLMVDVKSEVIVEAENIKKRNYIDSLNLKIKKGEIVGFAGLLGSGRTETAHLLFGLESPDEGNIRVNGREVKIKSPLTAIKRGIALCPEDRKYEGIFDELSVRENIIIALQAKRGIFKYIPKNVQEEITKRYIDLLNIKTPSPEQLIKNLSGGNQQKVIVARWLATDPQLLILDEPTKGIDVEAKTEIQRIMFELAKKGISIIFISSELEEVVRCAVRLAVFKDKRKIGELIDDDINENKVMQMIAGGN